jgi:cytosine/adenosine deaminase-related metal-dependent hydrolase
MRLGSGIAPVRTMLHLGVPVGLGVDGSASNDSNDVLMEARQALLLARVLGGADALNPYEALGMATRGGARCLGRDDLGQLAPGKAADVALYPSDGLERAGAQWDLGASLHIQKKEAAPQKKVRMAPVTR